MTDKVTYLDHHASAPLLPVARMAMNDMFEIPGSPSSPHSNGRRLRAAIESARDQIALVSGTSRGRIVFTGSATEALTQAVIGGSVSRNVGRILYGAGEHIAAIRAVEASGRPCAKIPMRESGEYDVDALRGLIAAHDDNARPLMIVVQLVNNETGVVQPVSQIERLLSGTSHLLVADAAQGLGKLQIFFDPSRMDMMVLSGHKIGGPVGVGALVLRPELDDVTLIPGGGQEQGRRGGTQSAALIAGFGQAAAAATEYFDRVVDQGFSEQIEDGLRRISPEIEIFGREAIRTRTAVCFAIPGLKNTTGLINYDIEKISLSAGSACSSGKVSGSHVLAAMGVDPALADCALRVSVGWSTTREDIDRFLAVTAKIVHRHRSTSGAAA